MVGLVIGIVLALFALRLGFSEGWHWIGVLFFAAIFVALGLFFGLIGALFGALVLGATYKALA